MKRAVELGYVLCGDCHQVNVSSQRYCQHCGGLLEQRKANSTSVAWAWLVTACVMIIPANLYPITLINSYGVIQPDTIFSGIVALVKADLLPIAIIVFVASILVPILKIVLLFYIYLSLYLSPPLSHRKVTQLYHFVEWIGRWSMLDLFVISLMIVLLDMGQVSIEAGPAILPFAIVVLSTMLSARAFDTRLLWDRLAAEQQKTQPPSVVDQEL